MTNEGDGIPPRPEPEPLVLRRLPYLTAEGPRYELAPSPRRWPIVWAIGATVAVVALTAALVATASDLDSAERASVLAVEQAEDRVSAAEGDAAAARGLAEANGARVDLLRGEVEGCQLALQGVVASALAYAEGDYGTASYLLTRIKPEVRACLTA